MRATCENCHNWDADEKVVDTDAGPATILVCQRCDRIRCPQCSRPLPATAIRCPACATAIPSLDEIKKAL